MKINKYQTYLNKESKLNTLIKESEHEYGESFLRSPTLITNMLNTCYKLADRAEEYLYMIAFDTQFQVLGVFEVSHGVVNSTMASPRELFVRALLCGAANIVLAHNHPSGVLTPSEDDINLTNRVRDCGNLLSIKLVDHLILGNDNHVSLKEMRYL